MNDGERAVRLQTSLMRKNWCDVLGNCKTVAVDKSFSPDGTKKKPLSGSTERGCEFKL
jgi:hypothetical protein